MLLWKFVHISSWSHEDKMKHFVGFSFFSTSSSDLVVAGQICAAGRSCRPTAALWTFWTPTVTKMLLRIVAVLRAAHPVADGGFGNTHAAAVNRIRKHTHTRCFSSLLESVGTLPCFHPSPTLLQAVQALGGLWFCVWWLGVSAWGPAARQTPPRRLIICHLRFLLIWIFVFGSARRLPPFSQFLRKKRPNRCVLWLHFLWFDLWTLTPTPRFSNIKIAAANKMLCFLQYKKTVCYFTRIAHLSHVNWCSLFELISFVYVYTNFTEFLHFTSKQFYLYLVLTWFSWNRSKEYIWRFTSDAATKAAKWPQNTAELQQQTKNAPTNQEEATDLKQKYLKRL